MTADWLQDRPSRQPIGVTGWARAALRGTALAVVTFGGLAILLLIRLAERPLCGRARPITPHVSQFVCRTALRIIGIGFRTRGRTMVAPGAVVANHGSWLDIFALNAAQRVYFVSKSEVAGWPGIGWLARATGTVFIARRAADAKRQQAVFEARLRAGHRLLFFPEGTSSDTRRMLPFKPTLFAAFFSHGMEQVMHVQPVCVIYHPPPDADPRFYGWWSDMDFASHLLIMLAAPRHGAIEVLMQAPLAVDDFPNRKALSARCEAVIREAHVRYSGPL